MHRARSGTSLLTVVSFPTPPQAQSSVTTTSTTCCMRRTRCAGSSKSCASNWSRQTRQWICLQGVLLQFRLRSTIFQLSLTRKSRPCTTDVQDCRTGLVCAAMIWHSMWMQASRDERTGVECVLNAGSVCLFYNAHHIRSFQTWLIVLCSHNHLCPRLLCVCTSHMLQM